MNAKSKLNKNNKWKLVYWKNTHFSIFLFKKIEIIFLLCMLFLIIAFIINAESLWRVWLLFMNWWFSMKYYSVFNNDFFWCWSIERFPWYFLMKTITVRNKLLTEIFHLELLFYELSSSLALAKLKANSFLKHKSKLLEWNKKLISNVCTISHKIWAVWRKFQNLSILWHFKW